MPEVLKAWTRGCSNIGCWMFSVRCSPVPATRATAHPAENNSQEKAPSSVSITDVPLNPTAAALLERFERPLLAFARHLAGDAESARDAVQDTFLRYFKNPPVSDDLESLAPWLFTVCRRLLIDYQRKSKRLIPMTAAATLTLDNTLDESTPEPARALESKDDSNRLHSLIRTLPERQRELVRLKFEAGLSYRDIASATGLSVSNVGTLLHQAVQSLREQFHAA